MTDTVRPVRDERDRDKETGFETLEPRPGAHALAAAGAWSDLDLDEMLAELDRIRHGDAPASRAARVVSARPPSDVMEDWAAWKEQHDRAVQEGVPPPPVRGAILYTLSPEELARQEEAARERATPGFAPTDGRELAGVWSDLDWDEFMEGLDEIRSRNTISPPYDDESNDL